ncbi:4HBT domain-containing protein [Mycena indigotica]|uniref:4HBT domain-containing protein n=1 Tax=Mycena indigotica TaxID=2126181 RepID=A0A8H6S1C8_9AGAR|nr:4HBT domain-containing protein [Mycena indigotica]KAF7290231.1 4HBT domain-containing protein [Mycena indigotica]
MTDQLSHVKISCLLPSSLPSRRVAVRPPMLASSVSHSTRSSIPKILRSTPATWRQMSSGPKPRPTRAIGTLATLSLAAGLSLTAYGLGSLYPPSLVSLVFPRPAPAPPADASSPESLAYTASLEEQLQALPFLAEHRTRPDASEWYEGRPHKNLPEAVRVNSLTSGALRGPGKLALIPLVRARRDEQEALAFVHLGRGLCGHDGIIHGGLLATLLDEALFRTAAAHLPSKAGVTAKLTLNYRAPTRADQFVVLRTSLVSQSGRKAFVKGTVEALDGTVLVEAEALFIEPRYAKLMKLNTAYGRQVAEQEAQRAGGSGSVAS